MPTARARRFAAAVDQALALARPSDGSNLAGFSIDATWALEPLGRATVIETEEPRCLLAIRLEVPRARFEPPVLARALRSTWLEKMRYRHHQASAVTIEPHRVRLRFVTRTGDTERDLAVTGVVVAVRAPLTRRW